MTYQVLEYFEDLQDLRHPYPAGSTYPRKGYDPGAKRIAELCSATNKRGRAVIKAIEQEAVKPLAPASVIEKNPVVDKPVDEKGLVDEPVVKPKRGRRKKNAD